MSDPHEVVKRLQEAANLPVQLGKDGPIIAEPTGYISTRCPTLDYLIGKPGIPLGGISLFIGAYGSGKSTIGLAILAETQARGGQAVLFDTEGRFNFDRAEKLGVDIGKLIIAQPNTLQEAFAGVKSMIHAARDEFTGEESIVILFDSIAGAPMEKELKGEKQGLGDQAILIKRELRVMSNLVNRQRIGLVITTQPRQKIRLGSFVPPPLSWLGEDPLGHAAMTTIHLEEKGIIGDKASPISHEILATLIDTRIAGCTDKDCKTCTRKDFKRTFDFFDATGTDFFASAMDVLLECGIISSAGGWFKYLDEEKGFRRDDFAQKMDEQPEILDMLSTILKGSWHGLEKTK